MAASYSKAKGRSSKPRYASMPHRVLDSEDYLSLSPVEKTVLMALCRPFNGHNNGDLSLTHERAKEWGIGSKSTLAKALRVLREKNLIIRTRDPLRDRENPHGQCSLCALTWMPIDECGGKLDVSATKTPARNFGLLTGA